MRKQTQANTSKHQPTEKKQTAFDEDDDDDDDDTDEKESSALRSDDRYALM